MKKEIIVNPKYYIMICLSLGIALVVLFVLYQLLDWTFYDKYLYRIWVLLILGVACLFNGIYAMLKLLKKSRMGSD